MDRYQLCAFVDSSKFIYGLVVYIVNLNTNKISFLLSKNKLINNTLKEKSIPGLKMQAVEFACEILIDLINELSGTACIKPINFEKLPIYTDSLITLWWLNSHSNELSKLQNLQKNIFVMNRLHKISRLCDISSISFYFISGEENPADCVTRPMSSKQLLKSNFPIWSKCVI